MENFTTDAKITIDFKNMDLETFHTIRGIINKMALDYHFDYRTESQKIYDNDYDQLLVNSYTTEISS